MPSAIRAYTRAVNQYTGPQCNADSILLQLKEQMSHDIPDRKLILGLVDCDLYSHRAQWNFLWGWSPWFGRRLQRVDLSADTHDACLQIGLVSFARGGGNAADTWAGQPGVGHLLKHHVRTTAKLALRLDQCTLARCLFNGVGCDEEMTAVPWVPCPCCLRKLVASGAVASANDFFSRLLNFFERHNAEAREQGAPPHFDAEWHILHERLEQMIH